MNDETKAALRAENGRRTEDLADCGIRLGTAERAVIELRARVAELEAQVAAARAWAKTALDHHEVYGEDESGAYALLRAMDEAASKVKEH